MRSITAIAIILLFSTTSFALDYELCKSAKEDAEKGDIYMPGFVGNCYKGDGFHKNLKEAAKWYQIGMDRGDVFAAISLGDMYLNGEGVQKKPYKAMECFYMVAKSETNQASIGLKKLTLMARDYSLGINGVSRNKTLAEKLFGLLLDAEITIAERDLNKTIKSAGMAEKGFDHLRNQYNKDNQ